MSLTRFALTMLLPAISVAVLSGAPKGASKADLTLTDLTGKRVHLRDYRGQIVVLNFWATWCGPCKDELPMLVETEKIYKAREIQFLGASLDDSKSKSHVPEFISAYDITFPIWVGATADDLSALGMGEAVPATAFIDQEGHVAARVLGEIRKAELTERIEWLLGDRHGPSPRTLVSHLDK